VNQQLLKHRRSYLEPAGYDGVDGSVESAQLDFALQLGGRGRPVWSEVLTVTTPRREELNEPHVIRAQHQLLKVAVGQFHDVLRITRLKTSQTPLTDIIPELARQTIIIIIMMMSLV